MRRSLRQAGVLVSVVMLIFDIEIHGAFATPDDGTQNVSGGGGAAEFGMASSPGDIRIFYGSDEVETEAIAINGARNFGFGEKALGLNSGAERLARVQGKCAVRFSYGLRLKPICEFVWQNIDYRGMLNIMRGSFPVVRNFKADFREVSRIEGENPCGMGGNICA